jgi:hypothetical protein
VGEEALAALVLVHSARQLKYDGTDKDLVIGVVRSALSMLDA